MELGGLWFDPDTVVTGPARCSLDVRDAEAFVRSLAGPRPLVVLLPNASVDRLAKRAELVGTFKDRGTKHPAKGLSRLLLGSGPVAVIRGRYGSVGQLKRSVRTLLRNARRSGMREAFVIGVPSPLFDMLWMEAGPSRALRRAGPGGATEAAPGSDPGDRGARELLELLADLPVPRELVERFVGDSPSARLVRQLILRGGRTDEPVLIMGDTGTGKEIVARSIHEYGSRFPERFTPVNCGAIPGDLLESELFGHVRGAFTSAVADKQGLWKVAGRGTLFLDEIGDLRLDHQAKILRALQEGLIRPVGGRDEVRVHARVIAATNRDLYRMVRAGEFRADLYFRLRSFLIRTPRLQNHPEDIPALANYFWRSVTGDSRATLPEAVLERLCQRSWPGNARELRAVLAHLNSLFPAEAPRPEFLKAVFQLQGRESGETPSLRMRRRLRSLHSRDALLRLEDILRASRATLRPLGQGPGPDGYNVRLRQAVGQRTEELRAVIRDGSEDVAGAGRAIPKDVLDAAREFRRALVEIGAELEIDAGAAARRWRRSVRAELGRLLDAVEKKLSALDRG